LNNLSKQQVLDWLDSPVTQEIGKAFKDQLDSQQAQAEQAFWAGRAWSDSKREAFIAIVDWHSTFFEMDGKSLLNALGVDDEE
jgi:hypothetical protein